MRTSTHNLRDSHRDNHDHSTMIVMTQKDAVKSALAVFIPFQGLISSSFDLVVIHQIIREGLAMGFIVNKNSKPSVNLKWIICALFFGITLLVLDVVIEVFDPVRLMSKLNSRVDNNSLTSKALKEGFESVHLSAYLFNVTNADRFEKGLDPKLKLQEVGPFTYREMKYHDLLEINRTADFIRYAPNITTTFLPEESSGRPEDTNVTMPNIAMLSMASKMSTFSMIPRLGFNLLAARLKSKPIVHMSAQDYLWGYSEPLIKLGNSLFPGWINFDKLGLLDRLYDKKAKYLYEMWANDDERFSIKTINGSGGLDPWGYKDPEKRSKCNTFTDVYEGVIYPSEMTPKNKVRIFRSILCRFLDLEYHGRKKSYEGVEGLEYRISDDAFTRNNDTECLCANGICEDGISDMSPCFLGLPMVLSNAHFLNADPKIYERIEGMKPDAEEHGSSFVIEPIIGMAMETQFSMQLNLYMRDVGFNMETSPYSNMVIPVAYFKILQPKITDVQQYNLRQMYYKGPATLLGIKIVLLVVSVALLSYSAFLLYWRTRSGRDHACVCAKTSNQDVPLMT